MTRFEFIVTILIHPARIRNFSFLDFLEYLIFFATPQNVCSPMFGSISSRDWVHSTGELFWGCQARSLRDASTNQSSGWTSNADILTLEWVQRHPRISCRVQSEPRRPGRVLDQVRLHNARPHTKSVQHRTCYKDIHRHTNKPNLLIKTNVHLLAS